MGKVACLCFTHVPFEIMPRECFGGMQECTRVDLLNECAYKCTGLDIWEICRWHTFDGLDLMDSISPPMRARVHRAPLPTWYPRRPRWFSCGAWNHGDHGPGRMASYAKGRHWPRACWRPLCLWLCVCGDTLQWQRHLAVSPRRDQ